MNFGIIKSIVKREFRAYFSTPIALVFLVVFLVLSGFFTFKMGGFFERGQADLRAFFAWHPWLYLFIVPALSMRLWAEEKRTGTIELLLTLPIRLSEALLGKFLAAWAFIGFSLFMTFPIVLTVGYLGEPDYGVIWAGYLGSLLMAGSFLAVGMAISSMTKNQIISFVVSVSVCLFLILLGFEPLVSSFYQVLPDWFSRHLLNLSIPYHFESIQRGVVDAADVIYFLSLIAVSLMINGVVLENERGN